MLALPNTAELTPAKCLTGHEGNLIPVDLFVSSVMSPKPQGLHVVRLSCKTSPGVDLHHETFAIS